MPYYDEILKKCRNLSKNKKIVRVFEIVRDIPYGDIQPRSPEKTWKEKKGPCSTKNIILFDVYSAMGIPVRKWMCSFEYKKSRKFTQQMNFLLDRPIIVLHTFIKIKIGKKWVIVDATNDPCLEIIGAKVQSNWDGKSDTLLAVKPKEFFHVKDIDKKKQEFYSYETNLQKENRQKFMKLFFEWIDKVREQKY